MAKLARISPSKNLSCYTVYMHIHVHVYTSLTRVDWTVLDRRAHGWIERIWLEGGTPTGPHGPTQQGVLLCSSQRGRPRHTKPRQVVSGGASCLYGCPVLSQELLNLFSLHLRDMVVGWMSKLGTNLGVHVCVRVCVNVYNVMVHSCTSSSLQSI